MVEPKGTVRRLLPLRGSDLEAVREVHLVWVDSETGALVFVAGEQDITRDLLLENRVELVLNTNHETQPDYVASVEAVTTHRWYPFYDASPHEQLKGYKENAGRAVADLVEAIRDGRRVLVHCRAGIHRSPGVVYAALVLLGRVPDRYEAFRRVVRVRPYARLYKKLVKWLENAGADELRYRASSDHLRGCPSCQTAAARQMRQCRGEHGESG